jgi:phospholipid/cholesterol/gamma-HCH transport system substrate-binding protein
MSVARNIDKTVVNIRKGAGGFQENMEAAKNNILFRGYFRKKEKKEKEQAEQAEDNQKKNTKSSSKK